MILKDCASPNRDARKGPIRFVVLHYTGMQDSQTALRRLTDPEPTAGAYPGPWQDPATPPEALLARVSAHYLVDEESAVWRLAPEEARAWHAGAGTWDGCSGLNDASIGIEIANGGHDFGLPPYPEAQIAVVIALLRDVLARHRLPPWAVIGHSDLAPARKCDPGEHFPWRRLAEAGVSVWPTSGLAAQDGPALRRGDEGEAVRGLQMQLAGVGYGLEASGRFDEATVNVVRAFQRRFRPERIDGAADGALRAAAADLATRKRAQTGS